MKNFSFLIFFILSFLFLINNSSLARPPLPPENQDIGKSFIEAEMMQNNMNFDPQEAYSSQIPCDVEFENSLDPYEQQDNYDWSVSPYPLIRTVMKIQSLDTLIEPGYYLLTPRKIGGRYYILFKQQGKIIYVVPVFEAKQIIPEETYPQPRNPYDEAPFGLKTVYKLFGIISGRINRLPKAPKHQVDCYQYNDNFYGIDIYYRDRLFKTIYKIPL